MTDRIAEIKKRLEANQKWTKAFQMSAHDKIAMIADTSALLMTLNDRLEDIRFLLERVEALEKALDAAEETLECSKGYESYWKEDGVAVNRFTTLCDEALDKIKEVRSDK